MIQKNSIVPLHNQVKDFVANQIDRGDYKVGDMLPPEFTLAEELGVSRNTIRQALLALVNEGRLFRERGKGTFVAENALKRGVPVLTGFHEYVKGLGQTPSSCFDSIDYAKSTPYIRHLLNIHGREKVAHIHRFVGIDGKRVGVHEIYLPGSIWRKLDTPIDQMENTSLYALLKSHCGVELAYGDETLHVRKANAQEYAELTLDENRIVFVVSRLLYDQDDKPICYADNIYHPEKFKYYIKYKKPGS